MPNLQAEEQVELVRASRDAWNNGDIDQLAHRFREDAALWSPFVDDPDPDNKWIGGRSEIIAHLKQLKAAHPAFQIVDAFFDRTFYALLLNDEQTSLCIVLEPDAETTAIKRMIICVSLL